MTKYKIDTFAEVPTHSKIPTFNPIMKTISIRGVLNFFLYYSPKEAPRWVIRDTWRPHDIEKTYRPLSKTDEEQTKTPLA